VTINDDVVMHGPTEQSTGFAQGDCLSPLLFSTLISKLPETVQERQKHVELILYADDLALISSSKFHVQQALISTVNYAAHLGLNINVGKTVAMKVSKSGRQCRDKLRVLGEYIPNVSRFEYLGLIVPANGKSYGHHTRNRVSKAIKAISSIRDPSKLSLPTAVKLFDIKVFPVVTYGVKAIWKHLTRLDLECIEGTKATFLKRVLNVHRKSRNRLVYKLAE